MPWSGLTNNQMVSYLDASTSGILLLSGQSHFTTLPAANQCMTKANMLAKYNLSASTLNAYGSLQLVPKGAWVSGVLFWPTTLTATTGGYLNGSSDSTIGYAKSIPVEINNGSGASTFGYLNGLTDPLFNYFEVVAFYWFGRGWAGPGYRDTNISLSIKGTLTPPASWVNVTINDSGNITTLTRTSATVTTNTVDNVGYVTWKWTNIPYSPFPYYLPATVDVN